MTSDHIVRRCVSCAFVMFPEEPYVLTEWGYTHPRCAPDPDLPAA